MTVSITLRAAKGTPLTTAEIDGNFSALASATNANTSAIASLGGGGPAYTLPAATASTLGGIKIGSGLSIDGSGVVSASAVGGVSSVNGRTGAVTLTSGDITGALGFTPSGGASATFSATSSGYYVFPADANGHRLIVQWAPLPDSGGSVNITFPMTFPSAAFGVTYSVDSDTDDATLYSTYGRNITQSSFQLFTGGINMRGGRYFAWGY